MSDLFYLFCFTINYKSLCSLLKIFIFVAYVCQSNDKYVKEICSLMCANDTMNVQFEFFTKL